MTGTPGAAGSGAATTTTTADATAAGATTEGKGAESGKETTQQQEANTGKETTASSSSDSDEDDAFFAGMNEHQKRQYKKLKTEAVNKKTKISELQGKLTERDQAEQEAQRKRDEEQGNWKNIAEAEQKRTGDLQSKLEAKNARIMKAELRNAAIKEGIIDPTDIDLFGVDGLTMDEDSHEISGIDKKMKQIKKEKPHLFKGKEDDKTPEGTTTGTQPPPPGGTPRTLDAMKMTPEEFREAEKKLSQGSKSRMY